MLAGILKPLPRALFAALGRSAGQDEGTMTTGIGETLREARHQQHRSLSDAAAETRVKESYLASLEEEKFVGLGGDVYVRGFLRSYARYLGLDPDPLVEAYRRDYERDEDLPLVPVRRTRFAPSRASHPRQRAGLLTVVVVLVAVVGALFVIGLRNDPSSEVAVDIEPVAAEPPLQEPAPPPAEAAVAPAPAELPPAPPPPIDGPFPVEVRVEGGPSWLRVTVDGGVELEGTQPTGSIFSYTAEETVTLRIGDAATTRLVVDGVDQGPLGEPGEVVDLEYAVGRVPTPPS